jgi:hypothetical protein
MLDDLFLASDFKTVKRNEFRISTKATKTKYLVNQQG